ncbi:phage late control protein [Deltaproteobacteria bacterium]|nr:phage late control protein [Deltaproteobacteria bacterium]
MRPVFTIQAGSRDITEAIRDRLLELSITDEAGVKSDQLKLTLDDRRRENGAIASLPGMGTVLSVSLGYAETSLRDMGSYMVDEIELRHPPATLSIGARAADMSGPFRSRKTRSWEASTLGAMTQAIAAEHGYTPKIDVELGSIPLPHLDQVAESDMALLTRIAEKHDAVAKPVHGHLVLARAGEAKSVGGVNLPQIRLDVSAISSWTYKHSARSPGGKAKGKSEDEKRGGFKARWWDCEAGKDKWVTVGEEPFEELPYRHKTEAEAKAAAAAKLNKGKRKEGGLSLTMPGNTSMAAECCLHIVLRPGLPTDWRITKAEHRLSNSGYTTQVDAEIFLQQQEKVT